MEVLGENNKIIYLLEVFATLGYLSLKMQRLYPGYFITLEGPEGCGKTSHLPDLVEHLRKFGLSVFPTREPGGTSIGEQIRDVLHDLRNTEMHPRTETLLFQSARAQVVEQVIRTRLSKGEIVISDRYADSTIAYQGYGHQQDVGEIKTLVKYATAGLMPDFTIYLDVDVEAGLKRKQKQNEWNRMDAYQVEFYQRLSQGYQKMILEDMPRWISIDANAPKEVVFTNLKIACENRLMQVSMIESPTFVRERR